MKITTSTVPQHGPPTDVHVPDVIPLFGGNMVMDLTRPSIRFPLTEAIARKENIELWYFDRAKWPDRVPIDFFEALERWHPSDSDPQEVR